jgi:hypothetical protein
LVEQDLDGYTCLITHSMEQIPSWEANRLSASQEILQIIENSNVHSCIHKCSPRVTLLSQLDLVYNPTSYFLKTNFNIILPSTPGSPKWSLSLRFPLQKPCLRLSCPPYALHATPNAIFSIVSPGQYWVRSTDH